MSAAALLPALYFLHFAAEPGFLSGQQQGNPTESNPSCGELLVALLEADMSKSVLISDRIRQVLNDHGVTRQMIEKREAEHRPRRR